MGKVLFYFGAMFGVLTQLIVAFHGPSSSSTVATELYGLAVFFMVLGLGVHILHGKER